MINTRKYIIKINELPFNFRKEIKLSNNIGKISIVHSHNINEFKHFQKIAPSVNYHNPQVIVKEEIDAQVFKPEIRVFDKNEKLIKTLSAIQEELRYDNMIDKILEN